LKLFRGGETNVGSATRALTLPARETLAMPAAALFDGFLDLSYAYRFGPPAHDLVVANLTAQSGALLAQAFHFIPGLSAAREIDVGMTATAVATTAAKSPAFEVTIATRRFAQSVWIEAEGFVADEAYFHLAPGSSKTVLLRRAGNAADKPLRGRVQALNAHTPAKIEIRG
jgi:beta-mannosidase